MNDNSLHANSVNVCMIHSKTPQIAIWTTKLKPSFPECNLKIRFQYRQTAKLRRRSSTSMFGSVVQFTGKRVAQNKPGRLREKYPPAPMGPT